MNSPTAVPFLLALTLCSGSLLAAHPEDESENIIAPEPQSGFVFEAEAHATFGSDADFDSDIGEFGFSEFGIGIKASRQVGDSGMLSFEFNAGLISYDITASSGSVVGDAANIGAELDDVTTLSLIGIYANQFNESSSWFIGVGALIGAESDADFGDSADALILGGFTHKINDKLELGLGVFVRTRLDDDVLVVPLPQIKYTINEYWSIESAGGGLKLNYKASDALSYGLVGEFASTTFRLDDSHASAPEGTMTHKRIPIAFYAQYAPNETIQISGRIGGMLAGEIEILDTDGNDITSEDIDTGIFGSINVSFKF